MPVADVLKGSRVALGAQDCHYEKEGAFTGKYRPQMLLDAGCKYVIIGHSERRHGLGETDDCSTRRPNRHSRPGWKSSSASARCSPSEKRNRTESVLQRQVTAGLAGLTDDADGEGW